MSKSKKILIAVMAACLILSGLWLYWEWEMPISDLIPEEKWMRLELRQEEEAGTGLQRELEVPLEPVLAQMKETRVTRRREDRSLDEGRVQLLLYKGEAYPTMLYAEPDGTIHIAEELDFDHWKCYEGGEELYEFLVANSRELPEKDSP